MKSNEDVEKKHYLIPKVGSIWEHTNGNQYRVVMLCNVLSQSDDYPVTVVYIGLLNGALWCRPLKEWKRSFVPVPYAFVGSDGNIKDLSKMKAYDGAKPSIGRIVHFYSDDPTKEPPKAAIIIETGPKEDPSNVCGLEVFYPGRENRKIHAAFSEEPKTGHWTWPPRV